MIGRVVVRTTPTKTGMSSGQVMDLDNWQLPISYWFSNYPQFGCGSRVGFDLAINPTTGVTYATNLREPTDEDLALLP